MTRIARGSRPPGAGRHTTIHYYATCWNEENILPHFLAHHRRLYDKIVIVDDGSTDRSLKLLRKEANVEVRSRQREVGELYIWLNTQLYNQVWKESRGHADWVVVGNIDEFIYSRDLRGHLDECSRSGVTIVPALGFEMVSRDPLQRGHQLMRSICRGAPAEAFCRFAIFNPDAIEEIVYLPGRHESRPTGEVVLPQDCRVLNLHYKRVGIENTFARMQAQNLRRTELDRRLGLGHGYADAWAKYLENWNCIEADCIDVFDWYRSNEPYPGEIPWRPAGQVRFSAVRVGAGTNSFRDQTEVKANDHTGA